MNRIFVAALAAASILACTLAAAAADIPVKAVSRGNFGPYPSQGCGLYYGLSATGAAAPMKDAPVGATALGGTLGALLGYTCDNVSSFWFVEGGVGAQAISSENGLGLSGPVAISQRVGFGGPINNLLSLLPGLSLLSVPSVPALPNGVTAGPQRGYFYAGLTESDVSASYMLSTGRAWIITPEFGVGMLSRLSNNVVVDTWAGVTYQTNGICIGGSLIGGCPKTGTGAKFGVALKY